MYTLSAAKIKYIHESERSGGFFFIPSLIAAIMAGVGAAGSVAGAAAGIAKAVNDKKTADEAQRLAIQQGEEAMAEQKRHNALMESAVMPPAVSGSGLGDELINIIQKIVRSSKHDLNTRERQLSGEILYNLAKDLPVEVKGDGLFIPNIPEALRGVVDRILGGLRSARILHQKQGSGLFLGPPPAMIR